MKATLSGGLVRIKLGNTDLYIRIEDAKKLQHSLNGILGKEIEERVVLVDKQEENASIFSHWKEDLTDDGEGPIGFNFNH